MIRNLLGNHWDYWKSHPLQNLLEIVVLEQCGFWAMSILFAFLVEGRPLIVTISGREKWPQELPFRWANWLELTFGHLVLHDFFSACGCIMVKSWIPTIHLQKKLPCLHFFNPERKSTIRITDLGPGKRGWVGLSLKLLPKQGNFLGPQNSYFLIEGLEGFFGNIKSILLSLGPYILYRASVKKKTIVWSHSGPNCHSQRITPTTRIGNSQPPTICETRHRMEGIFVKETNKAFFLQQLNPPTQLRARNSAVDFINFSTYGLKNCKIEFQRQKNKKKHTFI